MRNISEKLCTENEKTVYIHLIDFNAQSPFLQKSCLDEVTWKNVVETGCHR